MAPLPRLTRRADFLRVAAGRRKWVAPGLVLQAAAGPASEGMRVGFTASRKVGNAVARNRARRRLKAVSAAVLPVHARAGHDYVLIARAGTLTRRYQGLIEDLEEGLRRLGVHRT
ncbi:MAG TPA: ribonuclease P protein component [Dongiaceae bacterium]|nr:ribonuclease P protein component [Dongiaceae bacterium]